MGSSKADSASDGEDSGGHLPESSSNLFSDGEKVLAYHGPRIYEAKAHTFHSPLMFHSFTSSPHFSLQFIAILDLKVGVKMLSCLLDRFLRSFYFVFGALIYAHLAFRT
ncbi:hypothetical protein RJ639_013495 [Escallonia herrerae]|uniref:Uncharacterized protein n=1 Tax=Escallonia herrerae TaxID=1293975 RepID=A0AA88VGZ9_9ASTE|nr:hypothetical protein RJ639_013495 [Escallonia herrerae]